MPGFGSLDTQEREVIVNRYTTSVIVNSPPIHYIIADKSGCSGWRTGTCGGRWSG